MRKRRSTDLSGAFDGTPPSLSKCAAVQAVFSRHEYHIVRHIKNADAVVGCVAWLSSFAIIDALAELPYGCSIVTHRDRHLNSRSRLTERLIGLRPLSLFRGIVCKNAIEQLDATEEDDGSRSMLHHKFIVFLSVDETGTKLSPKVVWCGSANFTNNAGRGLESALVVIDETTAKAFTDEWEAVYLHATEVGNDYLLSDSKGSAF